MSSNQHAEYDENRINRIQINHSLKLNNNILSTSIVSLIIILLTIFFSISMYYLQEREHIVLINNQNNKDVNTLRINDNLLSKSQLVNYKQRSIFSINESNYNHNNSLIKNIYSNKIMYEFINNLTTINYYGQWDNLMYEFNQFTRESGNLEIEFRKIYTNYYNNIYANISKVKMIFLLKDEKYIDYYIKGNAILSLNSSIIKELFSRINNNGDNNKVPLTFYDESIIVDLYSCSFLGDCKKIKYFNTAIKIDFIQSERILMKKFEGRFVSLFSEIKVKLKENDDLFRVEFSASSGANRQFLQKVRNYSFILTSFAFIEMYFSICNLIQIKNDVRKCLGMDIITVCFSIITKSLICSIHFYLSITSKDDEISFEYGIPSIIYFFLLSFIEVRTLFCIFKAKYLSLYETNQNMFKNKLYCYSFLFYFTVFACLILCKLLVMNFGTCYFLFFATWGFQIIHSARVGIRPPMGIGYIMSVSFGKLFIPIYLKAYSENIFEFRPCYDKTAIVVMTVTIEISILFLQKNYGSKVIVPSFIQKPIYNYYYDDYITRDQMMKTQECAICLTNMVNQSFEEQKNDDNNTDNNFFISKANQFFNFSDCFVKINYVIFIIKRYLRKKPFMITPCNHVFHSECLEKWLELKSECPYCKQQLPQLE